MSGTLARRVPTNGTASPQDCADGSRLRLGRCQAFVAPAIDSAQDQASAQQDPDIAAAAPVARLAAMPVVSLPTAILHWLCAAARTLAGRFRRPADPSSSSPVTDRSAERRRFMRSAAGFREFTLPRSLADGSALRLRVKSAGVSTRIAPVAGRRLP